MKSNHHTQSKNESSLNGLQDATLSAFLFTISTSSLTTIPLAYFIPATWAFLLFLKYSRHVFISRPFYLLLSTQNALPSIILHLFQYLLKCHLPGDILSAEGHCIQLGTQPKAYMGLEIQRQYMTHSRHSINICFKKRTIESDKHDS